jgi:hypothetical protein
MAEQNLIEQLTFTLKIFARIFLFALIGYLITCGLEYDAIISYEIIIGSALIGAVMGVDDVLRRF